MKNLFKYLRELVSPRYKLVKTIKLDTGVVCKHYADSYRTSIDGKSLITVKVEK
jgi:hypothetical protein|tara:strand:- start:194 stop:355 length:162 start_codon:yes stop_codon:yes gene_type:complete